MINLSEVMYDPDFNQDYTVYRKTGNFVAGEMVQTETTLNFTGIVTVADSETLDQVPEGDRVPGAMCFYSESEIYRTRNLTGNKGTSDEIFWNTKRYKVLQVFPYKDYGYWKSVAARMDGD